MKNLRKCPFSLIEIGIAAGLFSIILFILFSTFKQSTHLSLALKKIRPEVLERQMFYQRCLKIFSLTDPNSVSYKEKILTFSFENPLDDDQMAYSGKVFAAIFVDEEENLTLEISRDADKKSRVEILKRKVKDAAFEITTPSVLMMKITPKEGEPFDLAFFLPKADNLGFAVRAKKEEAR